MIKTVQHSGRQPHRANADMSVFNLRFSYYYEQSKRIDMSAADLGTGKAKIEDAHVIDSDMRAHQHKGVSEASLHSFLRWWLAVFSSFCSHCSSDAT